MECEIFLGSICVLLEDIGFTHRMDHRQDIPMSYYHMACLSMGKVFADINVDYTVEMFLSVDNLMADRWELRRYPEWESRLGIYLTVASLDVDIHDPNSLSQVANFVEETIACAK